MLIKYRPEIDGLRAIAVLLVVIYHAFPSLIPGGFIGVDIFFVISGFLITSILKAEISNSKYSIKEFYRRRIDRLFPALLLVMFSVYIFGWFTLFSDEFMQLGKQLAGGAGFIANIVLYSETGYFNATSATKPFLHLWSLGIEEQFYLLFPVILYFSYKRKLNLVLVVCFLAIISFVLNIF
ncbi:TPA: acyltransferase, partial [Escherichia coli]|nr:acyltransferase [Escherichia coli]